MNICFNPFKLPFPKAMAKKIQEMLTESVLTLTGAGVAAVNLGCYASYITTVDASGSDSVSLPNGEVPGQRKLVIAADLSAGATVAFVCTNIDALTATLAADGDAILFEWNGAKWAILYLIGTAAKTTE